MWNDLSPMAALKDAPQVLSPGALSLKGTPWRARTHLFSDAKKDAGLTWSGAKVAVLKAQQVALAVAPDADSADAAHPKVLRFDFSGEVWRAMTKRKRCCTTRWN